MQHLPSRVRPFVLSVATTAAALVIGGAGHPAPAQTPQGVGDDTVAQFDSVRASIAALDRTVATIDVWLEGRVGEDSLVLASRRDLRMEERRALIWEASDLLPSLPGDSSRAAWADSMLVSEEQRLRGHVRSLVDATWDLRSNREELSPIDDLARERRLGRLDQAVADGLAAYDGTIERMAGRGMDTGEPSAALNDALVILAETLAGRMEMAREDVEALNARPSGTGGEDATLEVEALELRVTQTAAALESVLALMDDRDLATEQYRQALVSTTLDLTPDNLNLGVLRGLLRGWWDQTVAWIQGNGTNALFKILLFLLVLAVFRFLAELSRRLALTALDRSGFQLSQLLRETIVRWTTRVVMILGLLIALTQLGLDLGPLLAGLGVAGFIIGFALQDTLSNFAAGIMILLYRPFDMGDLVETGSVYGKVSDLSLVSTTFLSIDNQRYVVPNSQIWGNVIKNVTAQDIRRVDLVFGIGYADDIPRAEAVLKDVVAQNKLVLDDPAPVVKLHNLGDSSVDFVVRPWCKTEDYWDVHWDVTRAVKLRFDEEDITIPFPQRDVHLFHSGGEVGSAATQDPPQPEDEAAD